MTIFTRIRTFSTGAGLSCIDVSPNSLKQKVKKFWQPVRRIYLFILIISYPCRSLYSFSDALLFQLSDKSFTEGKKGRESNKNISYLELGGYKAVLRIRLTFHRCLPAASKVRRVTKQRVTSTDCSMDYRNLFYNISP